MSLVRTFAKRIAMGAFAAWAILTVVFVLFTVTDDWILEGEVALLQWAGAEGEVVEAVQEEYLAGRGLDRPLYEQYLDWLGGMATLDWGESFLTGEPAFELVVGAVARTALYVVPAIVLAVPTGILLGVYAAMNPDSRLASSGIGSTYALFAIPGFWVGGIVLSLSITGVIGHSRLVINHVLPVVFTAAALLGGYVSYSRAHALEYANTDFVKLVRAKGATPRRVATHVVRNAAIPFFSMLFTEAVALLVLAIFVLEVTFGVEGFGLLLFAAINERDLPVLLGGTIVLIGVGVLGNVIQDLAYTYLDPRVDTGSRRA